MYKMTWKYQMGIGIMLDEMESDLLRELLGTFGTIEQETCG